VSVTVESELIQDLEPETKVHPPGTIGFSVGEIVRYIGFVVSLQRCWRPEGTTSSYGQSVSIPENMNTIIRGMPEKSEWLWIQSDDHLWEDDALKRLLDYEVDIVVPLMIRRGPPFLPVINAEMNDDRSYRVVPYAEIPTEGLFEVHSAGSGGMLIRRHVIDAIIEAQGHDRVFEVEPGDKLAEDYVFCRKARELAGAKIYCAPEVVMGHQGVFAVWPEEREGKWVLRFHMGTNPAGQPSSFYLNTDDQQEV
jgi:hypothetical protein